MKWTKELPDRPGLWLWRSSYGGRMRAYEIGFRPGDESARVLGEDSPWHYASWLGGEWSDRPIPMPAEPTP